MFPAAHAQGVIKIGEINSYKAQPAFLEPYKKGMELAVEEINAKPAACSARSSS
jgi:branched-chain amino acid transport system substrate-binding protein